MNKKQQWENELSLSIINLMNNEPENWRKFFSKKLIHQNGITKRPYTAGNAAALAFKSEEMGYQSADWYTKKQIENLGGKIREGEEPTDIYCFFFNPNYGKTTVTKKGLINKNEYAGGVRINELYNAEQVQGLKEKTKKETKIIKSIREVLENKGYTFKEDETLMVYLDNNNCFHIPEEYDDITRLYNNGKILEEYWKENTEVKKSTSPLTSFSLEIASLLVMKEDIEKNEEEKKSREEATLYYKNVLKGHPETLDKALKLSFVLANEFIK